MATEKLDTQIRQEQIAQAALDLIAAHGLRKLSVAAVARRVGLVPSALYRHFKSKNDLLDATLALIRDRLLENVKVTCEETNDPVERLRRLLVRHIEMIRQNRGIPLVIFSQDMYQDQPRRKRVVYDSIRDYLDRIAEIVRDGQRQGLISPAVEPQVAAVMFLGLIQPAAILWHLSDGEFDVTRQAKKAWPWFCRAVQAEQQME